MEKETSCKGVLRAISLLTPISEEKHQELDGKYLCQTHYNYEVVNKAHYQACQIKLNEYALINLPARLYKVLELDSTAKICHRCIKYTDSDSDYITNNDYTQATKWSSQDKNISQKAIQRIKPFQNLSKSMQYKRCKNIAMPIPKLFYNEVQSIFHPDDKIVLNEVIFSANNQQFRIVYNQPDNNNNLKKLAIVRTMDKEHISRNMYRVITGIKQDLPKEWAVSEMKQWIDNQIKQVVLIHNINLDTLHSETNENIDDED
ncbi:11224_t:CDS:2, partial [Gigaspora rosea]